ncbi:phosphoglycerate dehydrogenase-like enzyme [Breoghania corrubedonensis]|uniref:Phosphoglycerate dehydrogenase-like enzyme n=1 Tax=Breoghania corrubedonensis TaxID=665038 RepID=A0A2T5V5P4_9HYPH|nr:D-2-hydroxyacid dehydrogenase family protein [Breoghania corrubedonensis]PTW59046.1 phosphoglycerate dehydrogenase-like enzyme [Breoghania corrubedonensis]
MRIAVLDDYQRVALSFADWSKVKARAEVTVYSTPLGSEEDVVAELQPYDAVCLMRERTPFPASVIDTLPNLKLIVTTGMRNAALDVGAAERRGIVVSGTHSPGHATAELAFGLMIGLARNMLAEVRSLTCGGWQVGVGRDLRGATLGIIGLGRLGSQMAGFGKAFGMDVIAWSENLTDERCAEVGVGRAPNLEGLLRRSDFVTIHTKLSERTRGLIGASELALMKHDAILINTSRAPIVDTMALIAALSSGHIGGAGIDVFDEEPLAAVHPLHAAPNLLMTPHLGYVTRETYAVFYRETVEALEAFLSGDLVRPLSA